MKRGALWRCLAFGIAAFAAVVSLNARGVVREVAGSDAALAAGGAGGGDIVYKFTMDDGTIEYAHVFTNTASAASFTISETSPIAGRPMRILAVAGGGSGGNDCGGGGGAGGVFMDDSRKLTAGDYTITVGAGGAAWTTAGTAHHGDDGGDSLIALGDIDVIRVKGGGGGGTWDANLGRAGNSGGSGGGGSSTASNGGATTQRSETSYGLGYAGGGGLTPVSSGEIGGGGGGAGGAGDDATAERAGNGGPGVTSDIMGESVVYAEGGAGAGYSAIPAGYGGGNTSDTYGNGGDSANPGYSARPFPSAGGGGGGGGRVNYRQSGGGANGIVIIRYAIPLAWGEDVVGGTVGGQNYYSFLGTSGTFKVLGAVKARVLAVGGGGSGANHGTTSASYGGAGGGGAGGMVDGTFYFSEGLYTVNVGAGGDAQTSSGQPGNDGKPSYIVYSDGSVTNVFAFGGGGGGIGNNASRSNGLPGGSGGGGSYRSGGGAGGAALQPSSAWGGYGNAGGQGEESKGGAGGGGAGSAGANANTDDVGGAGGEGRTSDITGPALLYAAGGGGGARTGTGGAGGSGIGGDGASASDAATAGTMNTGSGGGGGTSASSLRAGAAGGSGIVVIRIEEMRAEGFAKPSADLGSVAFDGERDYCLYDDYDPVFMDVTGTVSTNVIGSYSFTVSLKPGMRWSDGTSDAVTCTWSITQSTLSVSGISVADWQAGEAPSTPVVSSTPALSDSWRRFDVSTNGVTWTAWDDFGEFSSGDYIVRLVVFENDSYTIPSTWKQLSDGSGGYVNDAAMTRFSVFEYDESLALPDYLGYHTVVTVKPAYDFPDTFAYHVIFTVTNTPAATLTNFPMLVRFSEATLPGAYETMKSDGSDIRFTLAGKPSRLLPFEIDTWNPSGESLIWVKVPEYAYGAQIVMNWGEVEGKDIPSKPAESVWTDYAAVWHLNEEIDAASAATATSADATDNGNTAVPTGSADNTDLSLMVSTNAVFGNGRVNGAWSSAKPSNFSWLDVANFDNSSIVGSPFTFSAWIKAQQYQNSPVIFAAKESHTAADGWCIGLDSTRTNVTVYGAGSTAVTGNISTSALRFVNGFVHVTVVYDGTTARIYGHGDGDFSSSGTINAATAVTGLALGGFTDASNISGSTPSFWGSFDEIRIRRGAVSDAWAKEEYAQSLGTCKASEIYTADSAFTTLTNFPMLVRVSDATVPGIYRNTREDASDIRFTAPGDPNTQLPFEIDTWNPDGESLIWVQVPEYKPAAKVVMSWGELADDNGEAIAIPAESSASVWADYAGVWHLNEEIAAADAATTASADATGNGNDAVPRRYQTQGDFSVMVSQQGVFGNSRVIGKSNNNNDYTRLQVPDFDNSQIINSSFTWSAWISQTANAAAALFSTKTASSATAAGWEGRMEYNYYTLDVTGYGNSPTAAARISQNGINNGGFIHVTVVYNVTTEGTCTVDVHSHGAHSGVGKWSTTGTTINRPTETTGLAFGGNLDAGRTFFGAYDEIRLRKGAVSAEWAEEEYQQSIGTCSPGPIYLTTGATFLNRWISEPSVSSTSILAGDDVTVDVGEGVYGSTNVTWHIESLLGEDLGQDFALPAGTYYLVFRISSGGDAGTISWTGVEKRIMFVIRDSQPSYRLGDAAEVTRKGLVLLANDDANTTQPVQGQAYYLSADNVTGDNATYWVHEAESASGYDNLFDATVSTLTSKSPVDELCGSCDIWHLHNVRIGNLYGYVDTTRITDPSVNYLPQSRTAKPVSSASGALGSLDESAALAMRNIEDAAIYSPCYTNGIGTIYFDAVNASTTHSNDAGEYFGLVVEVCTNSLDGAIPTDENVRSITTTLEEGIEVTTTNRYHFAADYWMPVEMTAVKIVNGMAISTMKTAELDLDIEAGGGVDSFYRVYVDKEVLGFQCPARFRIRRSKMNGTAQDKRDGDNMILVDNIQVSPPPSRVDFEPYGNFDSSKTGSQVTGWSGAFEPAFPSITSEEIRARMKATFFTNNLYTSGDGGTNMLASAAIYYRWRYLGQAYSPEDASDWNVAALAAADGFRTVDALDVPHQAGDIEFWTLSQQSAPFYIYYDYSGLGIGVPGYSEEITLVTNRCTDAAVTSKTLGTDWFVRLRDGASNWENVALTVIGVDGGTNTHYATLAEDATWRCYLKTPTNATGTVKFRLEGINRQADGDKTWSEKTVYFVLDKSSVDTKAEQGKLSASYKEEDYFSDSDWYELDIDAATGYLLFQVDDAAHSISVVHADYQNFNEWTDAAVKTADRTFVGAFSEAEEGPAVGTSSEKQTFTSVFSSWNDMPAGYPQYWRETLTTTTGDELSINTNFVASLLTPNGWTANYGKIIYQTYDKKGSDYALQLRGNGLGSVQYVNSGVSYPRGIDTISFSARLANSIDFDDISYSDADGMTSLANYTFVSSVKVATNATLSANNGMVGASATSLVAYYRPGKGAYEFRITRSDVSDGRLELYKWVKVGKKMQCYLVGSQTFTQFYTACGILGRNGSGSYNDAMYARMAISVTNMTDRVRVMGVITRSGSTTSAPGSYAMGDIGAGAENAFAHLGVYFDDYGTDYGPKLERGTVGIVSANSPAVFAYPRYYDKSLDLDSGTYSGANPRTNAAYPGFTYFNSQFNMSYPSGAPTGAIGGFLYDNQIPYDSDDWSLAPGRLSPLVVNSRNSLCADVPSQTLGIYLAPAGSTAFSDEPVAQVEVSSFTAVTNSPVLRTVEDCSVQVRVSEDDNPVEVVVDDLEFTQWRGEDWENLDSDVITGKPARDAMRFAYTNFTFTTCWVTNNTVLMSARRSSTNSLCSIVSPLMDGWAYSSGFTAGTGLGQISFRYHGADTNTVVAVQVLTNSTIHTQGDLYGYAWEKDDAWITITNFTFTADDPANNIRSCYIGMRGVHGLVRLVIPDSLVEEVADSDDETAFGDIYIDSVTVRDEPDIDFRAWWGWNIRTLGDADDEEGRMLLGDVSEDAMGLSLALNNSVLRDIDAEDADSYPRHLPFVQTPTFGTNIVGAVTLKARKYVYTAADADDYETLNTYPAYITIYGSFDGEENGTWYWLKDFEITSALYTNLSYTTSSSDTFRAFRFVVRGVKGVTGEEDYQNGTSAGRAKWADGTVPVRVLIDELAVTESVRPRVGFRGVGAFRSDMNGDEPVPNVPGESEQPLWKEGWGVQCEIYKAQLPDMIDFESASNPPKVILHWYVGEDDWGYTSWSTNSAAKSVELMRAATPEDASETKWVFRSSYLNNSVVPETRTSGTVVQYMLEVRYNQFNDDGEVVPATNFLTSVDWQTPPWYRPIDLNAEKATSFSAYTILDSVAPYWAWINEVNVIGIWQDYANTDANCQFVEIAAPAGADLTGWRLEMLAIQGNDVITNVAAVFGEDGLSGTKDRYVNTKYDMTFRVIGSPASQESAGGLLKYSNGTLDGVWSFDGSTTVYGRGEIDPFSPIAVRLVRPRGILESEIVAAGTNYWAQWDTPYAQQFYPEVMATNLNELVDDAQFVYIGTDDNWDNDVIINSLSVITNVGGYYACWTNETYSCWTNGVTRTPGRINKGQVIEGTPPSPGGMSRFIYACLEGNRIEQFDADGEPDENGSLWTTNDITMYVQRNYGTNLLYRVPDWHSVRSVSWVESGSTVTNRATAYRYPGTSNDWYVNIGTNVEGNITVIAQSAPSDEVAALIGEDNRYRDAILQWLVTGKTLDGRDWEDSDKLYLAEFHSLNGTYSGLLNLTQMFWLDIPPTTSNMWLVGGMYDAPQVVTRTDAYSGESLENVLLYVKMYITNANENSSFAAPKAWAPYVIQGMQPGYDGTSRKYIDDSKYWVWTNATFKIRGKLASLSSTANDKYWVTMREFVFDNNSFDDDFQAVVEVKDHTSLTSPAYWEWYDWLVEHPTDKPFYFWALNDALDPRTGTELLMKTNTYETVGE